jgi:hypothetical protein
MELTLKRLLEQAEFKSSRGRYEAEEVDDFLDKAVAMATKVEAKLTQALDAEKAAGGPSPAEVEAEVARRVEATLAERAASGPSEDEMAEEARRTIVLAQRTADAAVKEAREDAAKLLADAQERAAALAAEADAAAETSRAEVAAEAAAAREEARGRLAGEIGELEGIREALRTDVTVLERHVEEQRAQLRSSVAELQRLLDDPVGFRMAPAPALLDPEVPDFAGEAAADAAEAEAAAAPEASAPAEPPSPSAPQGGSEPTPGPTSDGGDDAVLAAASAPVEDPWPESGPSSEAPSAPSAAAPQALSFDEVDHAAPGLDPLDGPPTAPVSVIDLGFDQESAAAEEPSAASSAGESRSSSARASGSASGSVAAPPAPPAVSTRPSPSTSAESEASSAGASAPASLRSPDASPAAGGEEDAFLAELRKAMQDDEPLGPREQQEGTAPGEMFDDDRRSWRFGKRR